MHVKKFKSGFGLEIFTLLQTLIYKIAVSSYGVFDTIKSIMYTVFAKTVHQNRISVDTLNVSQIYLCTCERSS